ncbi:MAG TPA: hypothetical protein VGD43_00195 [Micromonospora sp.]
MTAADEPAASREEAGAPGTEENWRRERATQSFWSTVVGVPAIISVLRLVVEAGGELQTTLLLVANVSPVNLLAAFVTTASRLVSASLVTLFAVSAVLTVSLQAHRLWPGRRRKPLMVWWKEIAPVWLVIVAMMVALVTWRILYLPLLLPAVAAAFQFSVRHGSTGDRGARQGTAAQPEVRRVPPVLTVALLVAYGWLVLPTVVDAVRQGEWLAVLAFVAPPVLALLVTGPVHRLAVRPLALLGPLVMLAMLGWTAYSLVTAPVLPLTVTTVGPEGGPTQDIQGHVVAVNDVHTVILQEHGGVRYVPGDQVRSQVLCPGAEELPRYRLWVHGFHVEDSLLEGLGRRRRPVTPIDAACRTIP